MMQAWQRLAWLEWRRSTFQGKQNLDFFWLTLLLTLTLLLALLLWGGREGLLNKFVDVSIGYVENAGIPIWLATNRLEGMDRELIQQLKDQTITLFPYREIEWHQIDWPDHSRDSWDDKIIPFSGWAVSPADPLWKAPTLTDASSTLPLDIILNRSLFNQAFKCPAYVAALQKYFPLEMLDIIDSNECLANKILWLDVKLGNNRELLPFRIHWQRHLPSIQPLAFLLPLSTLNTLLIANNEKSLHYYPDTQDNTQRRIKQLLLRTQDSAEFDKLLANVLPCLPTVSVKEKRLTLAVPIPEQRLRACIAQRSQLPLQTQDELLTPPYLKVTEFLTPPYTFDYDNQRELLTVACRENSACQPCEALPGLKEKVIPHGCEAKRAVLDVFKAVGSYQRAFAYVENRAILTQQLEKIKNFPVDQAAKAFYFHRTYDDALVRFKFIDKIMTILEIFFSPFFFFFLIILLIVQVGMVITHRKHNYGILLAKGISWNQIRWIVFFQLTLSFLIATVSTLLLGESIQALLAAQLAQVTATPPYVDHIVASGLDLLPLASIDYLKVGGMVLILLYVTGFFLLKIMIAKYYREPAYLFSALQ